MRPRYDDENTIIFLDVSDSTIIVVIISIADFVKNQNIFFYLSIERKSYFIFAVLLITLWLIICFIKSKHCICIIHFVKFKRTISIEFNGNRWVFLLIYLNKRYRRLKTYFLNRRWRWVCYRWCTANSYKESLFKRLEWTILIDRTNTCFGEILDFIAGI